MHWVRVGVLGAVVWSLTFGVAFAQGVEHLTLPRASVTDRALPPASDGGIFLDHPSSGAAKKGTPSKKAKAAKGQKEKKAEVSKKKTDKKAHAKKSATKKQPAGKAAKKTKSVRKK